MRKSMRPLFWTEAGLGSLTGILALITPVFPDWIEFISGWDPDQHDGTVEFLDRYRPLRSHPDFFRISDCGVAADARIGLTGARPDRRGVRLSLDSELIVAPLFVGVRFSFEKGGRPWATFKSPTTTVSTTRAAN